MRDYALGTTFDVKFTTRQTSGAPFTLAGTPVISAYPDNSASQITAGITLTVDFDGVTGLNNIRVVATSGNGYAAGSNYALVITTGTVNGVSVVGETIAEFSLEAQSPLRPTTAGRTLDVAATGEAGLDFNNVLSTALVTLHSLTITNNTTFSGNFTVTGTTTHTGHVSLSDGLSIPAPSTANRAGLSIVGNGSGAGIAVTGGAASGKGVDIAAGAGGAIGVQILSTGTFTGVEIQGGARGMRISAGVGSGHNGLELVGAAGADGLASSSILVSGTTALTGAVTAINAGNDIRGISIAVGGIGATAFTVAALNAIADAMLDRNMATGTDSGTNAVRTVRQALRFNRNKVDSTTGEVFKEDDATVSWNFAVTTAAGNPVVIIDPT